MATEQGVMDLIDSKCHPPQVPTPPGGVKASQLKLCLELCVSFTRFETAANIIPATITETILLLISGYKQHVLKSILEHIRSLKSMLTPYKLCPDTDKYSLC